MEQQDEAHEHPHHRLIEEIAERVEEKLVAKFAKWVIANGVALLVALVGGIAAYYDVKHDTRISSDKNAQQDARMDVFAANEREERANLERKIDMLRSEVQEINRFLRDHNQATLNGLSGRNGK